MKINNMNAVADMKMGKKARSLSWEDSEKLSAFLKYEKI